MRDNRLGCTTPLAIFASIITLLVIAGTSYASGSRFFTAGSLNAQPGREIGGITSHAEIGNDCAQCHPEPWSSEYMGDRCVRCHTDIGKELPDQSTIHGALKGDSATLNCRTCHHDHRGSTALLTEVASNDFPHAVTGFALTSHQKLNDTTAFTCLDCHPSDFEFDPTICVTCHLKVDNVFTIAHGLQFSENCLACHDGKDTYGKAFDPAQARFALMGKHTGLLCTQCHLNARSIVDLQSAPTDCQNCHQKDDPHPRGTSFECATCHNTNGWEENVAFDHQLAANFKLEGKHTGVTCDKCHTTHHLFIGAPTDCVACHEKEDPHEQRYGTRCDDCHIPTGWQENVKFDHNLAVNFKLEGKHISVPCEQCHTIPHQFIGTPIDCFACHEKEDKHNGEYGTNCGACHDPSEWKNATVDHNIFAFTLTGAHQTIPCLNCHINNIFKGTPSVCAACHGKDDAHRGAYGNDCQFCHTTSAWKPSTFSHNKTRFPLSGRHGGLSCTACHKNGQFAGTPASCAGCHGNPAFHRGLFGNNCESCHNTSNWSASYKGPHPNIADEGGRGVNHGGASCRDCHTKSLTQATCTKCHSNNDGGEKD